MAPASIRGGRALFHVVLFRPEIPPNTGNAIRLCANTGAWLHLVAPLGFDLDDTRLRRAGLDYHEWARVATHDTLDECLAAIGETRVFALSTKGARLVHKAAFHPGDTFIFGQETRGLPDDVLARAGPDHILRIPMRPDVRSINLSNTVAIVLYEAWRQCGFEGGV